MTRRSSRRRHGVGFRTWQLTREIRLSCRRTRGICLMRMQLWLSFCEFAFFFCITHQHTHDPNTSTGVIQFVICILFSSKVRWGSDCGILLCFCLAFVLLLSKLLVDEPNYIITRFLLYDILWLSKTKLIRTSKSLRGCCLYFYILPASLFSARILPLALDQNDILLTRGFLRITGD